VLASTLGIDKAIFRAVSKFMVLRGMDKCDYPQELNPFQDRHGANCVVLINQRSKRGIAR
jgi:hypothetical protein